MPAREHGLFASLRGLLASAAGLLRTRFELLAVELEEEKLHLLSLLAYGAAALLLLSAGAVFLAIFLTVLFWEDHRLLMLGLFTVVFLLAGSIALYAAWRHGASSGRMFSASLAELRKDGAALRGDEQGGGS